MIKAYAKVNAFLKITGKRGAYHEIFSRFIRVRTLYDELELIPGKQSAFDICGEFSCPLEKNTIYKAYVLLQQHCGSSFQTQLSGLKLNVEKRIPEGSGLGGGSSDAAAFMLLCNQKFHLGLSMEEMVKMGAKIGADVPFFLYECDSANVSGIGEVVKPYQESIPNLELVTPDIHCDTAKVYGCFREKFYKEMDKEEKQQLCVKPTSEVLCKLDCESANDLYAPAADLYPALHEYAQPGWFFSGSGSSFFRIKE